MASIVNTTPSRPRRTRNPPNTYTPSGKVNKNFNLNPTKTRKKRELAAKRATKCEIDKMGNTVITLSSDAYKSYLTTLNDYAKRYNEDQNSDFVVTDRKSVDKSDIETDILYKFKSKSLNETCTVNFYHTSCRILVNGAGRNSFFRQIHNDISNNLFQAMASARQGDHPSYLDEITQHLITCRPRPRNNSEQNQQHALVIPQTDIRGTPDSDVIFISTRSDEVPEIGPEPVQTIPKIIPGEGENHTDPKVVRNTIEDTNLKSVHQTIPKIIPREGEDSTDPKSISNAVENTNPKTAHQTRPQGPRQKGHTRSSTGPQNMAQSKQNSQASSTCIPTQTKDPCDPIGANEVSLSICCYICDNPVRENCIECSQCQTWVHYTCENLTSDEIKLHSENDMTDYVCSSCHLLNTQEADSCAQPATCPINTVTQSAESMQHTNGATSVQKGQPDSSSSRGQNIRKKQPQNSSKTTTKVNHTRQASQKAHTDEGKIVEMRSEILKLEGIINDQKDTIRTLKIKIAANEQSAYSNTGHASINVNQQNSIESRLRDLEFENIKRRLDILELTIQGRGAPKPEYLIGGHVENGIKTKCTNCECQHFQSESPRLGQGRGVDHVHNSKDTRTDMPKAVTIPTLASVDPQQSNVGYRPRDQTQGGHGWAAHSVPNSEEYITITDKVNNSPVPIVGPNNQQGDNHPKPQSNFGHVLSGVAPNDPCDDLRPKNQPFLGYGRASQLTHQPVNHHPIHMWRPQTLGPQLLTPPQGHPIYTQQQETRPQLTVQPQAVAPQGHQIAVHLHRQLTGAQHPITTHYPKMVSQTAKVGQLTQPHLMGGVTSTPNRQIYVTGNWVPRHPLIRNSLQ